MHKLNKCLEKCNSNRKDSQKSSFYFLCLPFFAFRLKEQGEGQERRKRTNFVETTNNEKIIYYFEKKIIYICSGIQAKVA